jgi:hypothetical protein
MSEQRELWNWTPPSETVVSLDGLFGLRVTSEKSCRKCRGNVGVLKSVQWPNVGLRLEARCVGCGERLTVLCRADQLQLIQELRAQRRHAPRCEPIPHGRSHRRPLERDRPARQDLDGTRRPYEGEP